MSSPSVGKLNHVHAGQPLTEGFLNRIIDEIKKLQPVAGKNMVISQSASGTCYSSKSEAGGKSSSVKNVVGCIGRIKSYNENTMLYTIETYPNGLGRETGDDVQAYCFDIAIDSVVPTGTYVTINPIELAVLAKLEE